MSSKLSSFITRERVKFYCIAILLSAIILQIFSVVKERGMGSDFPAFYAVGKVANNYPHSELYNIALQDKEYYATTGVKATSPFPYTPWFTIPLALLARLPYLVALALWTLMSVTFLIVGFMLIARAVELPPSWTNLGILACLAFPPYLFYTLINGQPSAFAFFILACAYFVQKNRSPLVAGIVLSFLSYKPTFLVFIGPMLLVTRQWRILSGLVIGGVMLALVSLLWAGVEGYRGFLNLISLFAQATNSRVEIFQTQMYVDVGASIRLLFGPQSNLRLILTLIAFPIVCLSWYRIGPRPLSWSLAIVCGLLFNLYSPIYDCCLLIFAVMLIGIETLETWLTVALYLIPVVTVPVAKMTGIQLYTLVLIALLIVLVRRAVKQFRHSHPEVAKSI